jgi:DNA-binding LacI/PurR family transcriptional regulator
MTAQTQPMPRARVSLRDVAREVGVSHVTVSLALRDHPRVSAERREEVKAAAEKLGYRPDPMLASLSAYRHAKRPITIHSTIAWLNQWPDPKALRRFEEFAAYWRGAREAAEQLGYRLEEFVVARDLPVERLQKILTTRGVRGVLIPPHARGLALPGFDWSEFSVVRFGVSVKEPLCHVTSSDHVACGALATMRVQEHGYGRVGFVTTREFDTNTRGNFRAGYLAAQDTALPAGSRLRPLVLAGEAPADREALRRWLAAERPEAVVTSDPRVRDLLAALRVRVPADLAVAALSVRDGNFDAGIEQNAEEIGRVGLRTLAGLINQNERGIPRFVRRTLVEGSWVDGESLPPKKAKA